MSTQTPREIAFEDIREGDRLRARRVEDGIEYTREGVAHKSTTGGWFTSEDGLIVSATPGATITLLHRPALAEPKGLGAVVRATTRGGEQAVFVRVAPGTFGHVWRGLNNGWNWASFRPGSIEVLSEGIEVES